ncbi:probable pyruvate, phosphate dikinase regulatory protein, chloroplastic [Elaeis guineensis]|uniref:Probable pyruvate, phosphate dikinase regulatory protein, chloroplastic n=1 Tax=Elaeis guineensis var. tenera TaxID=51953 RepID=A0A6I9S037_ELAGV|nr:probable pyruvate, phosphate dikinase regulatory protein, chloroplastic [Elaeis guineensis]
MPKESSKLNRWSMARSIRSGRPLRWSAFRKKVGASPSSSSLSSSNVDEIPPSISDDFEDSGELAAGKAIYMVSDGTGWTAEHSVSAALGQFEYCLHNRRRPVNTHLFSGVQDMDRLMEIIKQAGTEGALLLYTLADPLAAKAVEQACKIWGVPSTDILRPTTEAIASHFGVAPSGIPRGAPGRKSPITEEFLRRNEAVAFTIKQDDGARPQNLNRAQIVLVGVSRTGKTPLSIYLAQKGYKVANVPMVIGSELPKTLFEIDQEKVFGLTINPAVLQSIRNARTKSLKLESEMRNNYSEMDHVRKELEYANRIFMQNPEWPVIDITGRAIEETAAIVVRMYHDRKQKCALPCISKQY